MNDTDAEPCVISWWAAIPCPYSPNGQHWCASSVHYSTPHVCFCGVRK